jgi:superfamily II DNA helicase RecQ
MHINFDKMFVTNSKPHLLHSDYFITGKNVDSDIIRFIKQNKGKSGVIYCLSRKKVEEIAQLLQVNGISAVPYHAGLDAKTRSKHQDMFLMEDVDVVVATIAFGMGIDKPDVRFVVHLDLPDSLEAYFQEAGRAGRDGKTAYSAVFCNKRDEDRLKENFEYAFPSINQIKQCYQALGNYFQIAIGAGEGVSVDLDFDLRQPSRPLEPSYQSFAATSFHLLSIRPLMPAPRPTHPALNSASK